MKEYNTNNDITDKEAINKSIDEILLSIEANQSAINDMLTMAIENNSKINREMQNYAKNKVSLNKHQITAYAEYAKAYNDIKYIYSTRQDFANNSLIDKVSKLPNCAIALNLLSDLHTKQLNLMDYLCSIIEKAASTLKILCGVTGTV